MGRPFCFILGAVLELTAMFDLPEQALTEQLARAPEPLSSQWSLQQYQHLEF